MEKEAGEDYPAVLSGWQCANRGKKRGGWKRNKARKRGPDRGDGGDDEPGGEEGEEEEEEEEKEPPRRVKKSRQAEQQEDEPVKVLLPQRGDRWMQIPGAPLYTHELKGVLQTCRWLRDDVLSPEELHLFVYTDEGDTCLLYTSPSPRDRSLS
eukprot:3322856-Pyramimonas_sp.AAC.2